MANEKFQDFKEWLISVPTNEDMHPVNLRNAALQMNSILRDGVHFALCKDVPRYLAAYCEIWRSKPGLKDLKVDMKKIGLNGVNLSGMYLAGVDLSHAHFEDTILENVNFAGSDLSFARFGGAKMASVNLRYAMLVEANFDFAVLPCADLSYANAEKALFFQANLSFTTLLHTNFSEGMLENAILCGANMMSAIFTNACVSSADLSHAIVINVDFSAVNMAEEMDLTDIILLEGEITTLDALLEAIKGFDLKNSSQCDQLPVLYEAAKEIGRNGVRHPTDKYEVEPPHKALLELTQDLETRYPMLVRYKFSEIAAAKARLSHNAFEVINTVLRATQQPASPFSRLDRMMVAQEICSRVTVGNNQADALSQKIAMNLAHAPNNAHEAVSLGKLLTQEELCIVPSVE